jgi:hypothetical protein
MMAMKTDRLRRDKATVGGCGGCELKTATAILLVALCKTVSVRAINVPLRQVIGFTSQPSNG